MYTDVNSANRRFSKLTLFMEGFSMKKKIISILLISYCLLTVSTVFASSFVRCPKCGVLVGQGYDYGTDEYGYNYYKFRCSNGHHFRVYPDGRITLSTWSNIYFNKKW